MPKKASSWGQQEYVPAGNGDASGEYADENGSNFHFTNFEKPKEEKVEVKTKFTNFTKKEDNIEIKKEEKPEGNSFEDFVKNKYGADDKLSEFGEALIRNYNVGNDDAKSLVNSAIAEGVKVSNTTGISNYDGSVNLSGISKFGEYSAKVEGETFYHEFWHCFDNLYADKIRSSEDAKHIVASLGGGWGAAIEGALLTRNLSTSKVLSNGKTMYETLQLECRKLSKHTGEDRYTNYWDLMQRDYKKDIDNEIAKVIPNYSKYNEDKKKYDELESQFVREASKLYPTWKDGNYDSSAFNKQDKYVASKLAEQEGYLEFQELSNKVKSERNKAESRVARSWMSISDMYGIHKKVPYGFCGGHIGNYSKNKGAIAREFMAEYGSARSRNDEYAKKEIALFQKYFPETSKMCAELQDMIIKHHKNNGGISK